MYLRSKHQFVPIATALMLTVFASCCSPLVAGAKSEKGGSVSWTDAKHDFVNISVGGGPSVPVTFDTGSTGLIVFKSAVGSGAVATADAPTTKSFPGRTYEIKYESAKITIGGVTTVEPVKVGVVQSIRCTTPGCNTSTTGTATAGILGIGFGGGSLPNPIASLPSPYDSGFVVTDGGIELGLSDSTGFSTPLQLSAAVPSSSGPKAFNKYFQACFTVGGSTMHDKCVTTMFDTGVSGINIPPSFLPALPSGVTAVSVTIPNVLDFQFRGGAKSVDYPIHQPQTTHANLGLPTLLQYDVMLDLKNGTYRFRKHAAGGGKRIT